MAIVQFFRVVSGGLLGLDVGSNLILAGRKLFYGFAGGQATELDLDALAQGGVAPFQPLGPGMSIDATNISQSQALPVVDPLPPQIRVFNSTPFIAFWAAGQGSAEADIASSTPVLPGDDPVFTIDPLFDTVACVLSDAGPGTVYFQRGQGSRQ